MKDCVYLVTVRYSLGLDSVYTLMKRMNLSLVQHIRHWKLLVPKGTARPTRSCPLLWCVSVLWPLGLCPHHPRLLTPSLLLPHLLSLGQHHAQRVGSDCLPVFAMGYG